MTQNVRRQATTSSVTTTAPRIWLRQHLWRRPFSSRFSYSLTGLDSESCSTSYSIVSPLHYNNNSSSLISPNSGWSHRRFSPGMRIGTEQHEALGRFPWRVKLALNFDWLNQEHLSPFTGSISSKNLYDRSVHNL
ncbi:unnamed protein product [Nesidiocoris tenuis]|uniref:Uncharacterized protein n=1 Tax=Nesidiocoris tenuis TaxID=355587 RepID=A0A6H5HQ48_9HEMI|nr:unnamed protein product [Nesidiocoris tenuis]